MGKFAENLNLGKRVLPPGGSANSSLLCVRTLDQVTIMIVLRRQILLVYAVLR